MELINQIFYWIRPYIGYLGFTVIFFAIAIAGFFIARKSLKKQTQKDDEKGRSFYKQEGSHFSSLSPFALQRSFKRGMNTLKTNVFGRQFKYKIPWFMVLGQAHSGKSTVLSEVGLNMPVGKPKPDKPGNAEGCKWWFFDQGIMLDIFGSLILNKEGNSSDKRNWQTLLKLLQQKRSQRPIDGVILTIPCQELLGSQKNSSNVIEEAGKKAEEIYEKLFIAQRVLGIRFPVYILITQCDQIRGFKNF